LHGEARREHYTSVHSPGHVLRSPSSGELPFPDISWACAWRMELVAAAHSLDGRYLIAIILSLNFENRGYPGRTHQHRRSKRWICQRLGARRQGV
jgi:hypothetical protein